MKKIWGRVAVLLPILLGGCDLQPRILSLPDTVGEFISARYPALLADPETQPEIYNSAATDYGVYASPQLYGSLAASDEYVTYASVDDYIIPPQNENVGTSTMYGITPAATDVTHGQEIVYYSPDVASVATDDVLRVPMYGGGARSPSVQATVTVARGDTLYSIAKKYNASVDDLATMNNLSAPYALRIGQTLTVPGRDGAGETSGNVATQQKVPVLSTPAHVNTTTRVELDTITVAPGDTLYSLSRKYSVPVNDLAVMNNLAAPFSLGVGQKLKVPDLKSAPVRASVASGDIQKSTQSTAVVPTKTSVKPVQTTATAAPAPQKISSDPTKKLPKIGARSSSKFSWPVRGNILSHFGAKSGGLFNDGINIGAARGTTVAAAENGVVAYAGNEVKGMGNLIIIQHSDGWMTVYAHMDSMSVRRGARVSVGQKIGTVGETGKVDRPQLHFEIRKGTKAYNPSSYLKK